MCFIAMTGDHSDLICVIAGKMSIDEDEKVGDGIRDGEHRIYQCPCRWVRIKDDRQEGWALLSRWQFITEVLATISAVHIQCRRTLRMSKCKACNGTFAAILFSTRHSPESGGDQSPYTTLTTCSSRSYCLARSVCKSWARIGSKALQARVYRAQPYSIYKVYHSRELGDDEAYLQAFRGPTPFSVEVRKAMS